MFLIGTSCWEMTQASGYHFAWPRWAVLVSGSLTYLLGSSLAVPPTFQAWTSLMAFAQIVPSAQNGLHGNLSCFLLYS